MSKQDTYICINTFRLNITFSKKYIVENREELAKETPIQKIVEKIVAHIGGVDIVEVAHYINVPMAKYICLPRKKWLEYRRKAKEELRKYGKPSESAIRDKAIEMIYEEIEKYGEPVEGGGSSNA